MKDWLPASEETLLLCREADSFDPHDETTRKTVWGLVLFGINTPEREDTELQWRDPQEMM